MNIAIAVIVIVIVLVPTLSWVIRRVIRSRNKSLNSNNVHFFQFNSFQRKKSNFTDQSKRLFPIKTKIWFENSQKFVEIKKYRFQEVFIDYPFLSNFELTREKLKDLKVPFSKQEIIETYFSKLTIYLQKNEALCQSELYDLFINYGFPYHFAEKQWWEIYETFLESYSRSVSRYLYHDLVTLFLDFGIKSAFDAIELNDQYLKVLAHFNDEVVKFLEHLKQEFFRFFQNEHTQDFQDHSLGNYQSEIDLAYQTLGLDFQASNEDVKKTYRKLAKQYHPDKNKDEDAKDQMLKINAAYALIKKERDL